MSEDKPQPDLAGLVQASVLAFRVRSYESDAWGQVSAAGMLRYLEQAAIGAAVERGFGRDFHVERNSTWMIRRMTLQLIAPVRPGDELEITTWLSHLERVRGGREYRVVHVGTGEAVASALAEWVYLDRTTLRPIAIPRDLAERLRLPGAPLGEYSPPEVHALPHPHRSSVTRTAEWYECDSHRHVNNSVYADWLDEAMRSMLRERGYSTAALNDSGVQLRGIHYRLDYKRAALPEDRLLIETDVVGAEGNLCAVEQKITVVGGGELLLARTIYAWVTERGEPADPPSGWQDQLGLEA